MAQELDFFLTALPDKELVLKFTEILCGFLEKVGIIACG